ncbi:hypothetical protein [Leptolyngbya sp. NIES-2104]|uniref:hypothetical protein n=1 Tax=Leptolyngbya sp. NIES-2104 TaxID=1552121 RepID=UPI0006EC8A9D|nr:hypothetical protein [Leptolyngbya sp. NIES-2104]GAP99513.1 hypothetical protein NIES2104_60790 [Leptolyngbya sp. NIES-2104]
MSQFCLSELFGRSLIKLSDCCSKSYKRMNTPFHFPIAAALDEALPRVPIHRQVFLKTAKHVTRSNVFFASIYSYFENSDRALRI